MGARDKKKIVRVHCGEGPELGGGRMRSSGGGSDGKIDPGIEGDGKTTRHMVCVVCPPKTIFVLSGRMCRKVITVQLRHHPLEAGRGNNGGRGGAVFAGSHEKHEYGESGGENRKRDGEAAYRKRGARSAACL